MSFSNPDQFIVNFFQWIEGYLSYALTTWLPGCAAYHPAIIALFWILLSTVP